MDRKDLRDMRNTLLHYGYDRVVVYKTDGTFFCFGRGKIDPPLGVALYESQPIQSKKDKWVLHETIR